MPNLTSLKKNWPRTKGINSISGHALDYGNRNIKRELSHQLEPRALDIPPSTFEVPEPIHSPLYFHTTIDPKVHLTLNAQINSQVATALVRSY